MRKILTLITVLLLSGVMYAQNRVVTGKVTDDAGNPVAFASIKVKGQKTGAAADANGNYRIDVNSSASTLIISAQNIETMEVDIAGKTQADVSVKSTGQLSEVVVTGVGTATSKRKVAIDVGTLNSKDISKSSIASVEQALQGKIAGAQFQFTSGLPRSWCS